MTNNVSWLSSSASLVVVLGISAGLAIGVGGAGGCVDAPDAPVTSELAAPAIETKAPASSAVTPASFQVVFVCFDPNDNVVGFPTGTLSDCQAKCPAGDFCGRCVWVMNAVDCG